MDLHCPATVRFLAPSDPIPSQVGGQRVVRIYSYEGAATDDDSVVMVPAPQGNLWKILPLLADQHRGEGFAIVMSIADLSLMDLQGVSLSLDSQGPTRI